MRFHFESWAHINNCCEEAIVKATNHQWYSFACNLYLVITLYSTQDNGLGAYDMRNTIEIVCYKLYENRYNFGLGRCLLFRRVGVCFPFAHGVLTVHLPPTRRGLEQPRGRAWNRLCLN